MCVYRVGSQQCLRSRFSLRSVDVHWLSQTDGGSVPCSDLIIAVGPNASGEPSDSSAALRSAVSLSSGQTSSDVFLWCFRVHLGVCAELRRLDGGRVGLAVERAEPRIETTGHGPGPRRAVLRPVPAEAQASVRNRSKILPVHVYSKQFNNTVQGLFTRHILNYTGYNQKQDRSVDSAKKIQHKSIYKYR